MLNPYDEAIKEAYNSQPSLPVLPTLEFRHASFIDDEGNPTAIRVVYDHADLDAKLEDDTPLNPGEIVNFLKGAFQANPVESSDGLPEMQIEVDGVSREMDQYLDNAIGVRAPIELTYREYLADTALDGPNYVLAGLTVRRCTSNLFRVVATAGFNDFLNKRFPAGLITLDQFPGLKR